MQKSAVEYYECILDNLPGGLISVGVNGEVGYINPMAGKILHLSENDKALNSDYTRAFNNFPALCRIISDALETRKTVQRAEISIMHADVPFVIGYSTVNARDRGGRDLGVIIIFQDMSFISGDKKQYE